MNHHRAFKEQLDTAAGTQPRGGSRRLTLRGLGRHVREMVAPVRVVQGPDTWERCQLYSGHNEWSGYFGGQWARRKVETRAEDTTVVRAEDCGGTSRGDRKDGGWDDSGDVPEADPVSEEGPGG